MGIFLIFFNVGTYLYGIVWYRTEQELVWVSVPVPEILAKTFLFIKLQACIFEK